MGDEERVGKAEKELSLENLIGKALESKLGAIGGYDAIIWKIRAGYVAILYGALTLLLGVGGASGLAVITGNLVYAVSLLILILGLSVTAFIVDFSYVRKKLKVIVARDELIDVVLKSDALAEESVRILLHIAGETFVGSFPDKVQKEYRAKRNWNLKWVLVPLYTTTPVLAIFICLVSFGRFLFSIASQAS